MLCVAKNSLTLRAHVTWHIVVVQKPCVSIAWHVPNDKLCLSEISLIVKRRFPRITALTRSTVSLVRAVDGRPACESSSMDVWQFLNREYHSNVFDRQNAVSPNACCSISYVSVAVLPSFWQNLLLTRCSFNTSLSQYDGGTNTIALLINSHSRLSQTATRSSGVWRPEMLPSILHGCHFDSISSFSLKNLSRIFLTRPRTLRIQDIKTNPFGNKYIIDTKNII
jgi:hypothetical protein